MNAIVDAFQFGPLPGAQRLRKAPGRWHSAVGTVVRSLGALSASLAARARRHALPTGKYHTLACQRARRCAVVTGASRAAASNAWARLAWRTAPSSVPGWPGGLLTLVPGLQAGRMDPWARSDPRTRLPRSRCAPRVDSSAAAHCAQRLRAAAAITGLTSLSPTSLAPLLLARWPGEVRGFGRVMVTIAAICQGVQSQVSVCK